MATDVLVPTLGESITEATLGQWLKKPGDAVKVDEPIASLETDKVAVEVPSPVAGKMGEQGGAAAGRRREGGRADREPRDRQGRGGGPFSRGRHDGRAGGCRGRHGQCR